MKEKMHNNESFIFISVYFGKKDGELLEWVKSVPWGSFSLITRKVILAHLHGEFYNLPEFEGDEANEKNSITKTLTIKQEDEEIYNYLSSFDDNNRSFEIKKLLKESLKTKGKNPKASIKRPISFQDCCTTIMRTLQN